MNRISAADAALLFLRVTASVLVLLVHGLPKAIHARANSMQSKTRCTSARR
jgi:hypothetical protein